MAARAVNGFAASANGTAAEPLSGADRAGTRTGATGTPAGAGTHRAGSFWFEPLPLARVFWLRVAVYAFIPVDVALSQSWVRGHARAGAQLYQPLRIARGLNLPTPTPTSAAALALALVLAAGLAATGWRPRVSGSLVAALYLAWMLVAMSYGKVDHDRVAFLVALAVLPTVGAANPGERRRSAAAGWALQCIRVAVVLTYFYAAWAKIRFGGWNWPTGAVLERALLRRATPLSQFLIDQPRLLLPMQFAMIGLELASPLILLARSDRARGFVAVLLWGFHLTVFASVSIIFLPQCVAIAAFLPLERLATER
ncbi:MAG: hypothetical protein M3140_00535, partial [Actinomycetota bacterium]|nr:hypothetical protein [Actinomycetota bacterium]